MAGEEEQVEFRDVKITINGSFELPHYVRKIDVSHGAFAPRPDTHAYWHFAIEVVGSSEEEAQEKLSLLRKTLAEAFGGAP